MKEMILDADNFDTEVPESPLPFLVLFHSPACASYRAVFDALVDVEDEFGERIRIGRVDAGRCPALCRRFAIRTLPTFLLFSEGCEADRLPGADAASLLSLLSSLQSPAE